MRKQLFCPPLSKILNAALSTVSRILARKSERRSRQRIKDSSLIRRMDARPQNVRSLEQTLQPVHQLETRPFCHGSRCLSSSLEKNSGRLCLSPLLYGGQMPKETEGTCHNSVAGTSVASSTSVSYSSRESGREPHSTPPISTPAYGPLLPASSTSTSPAPNTASCLENIRRRGQAEGLSAEATSLISAGWSTGTNSVYQSAWAKWCSLCDKREIDPFSWSVAALVNYLASLYREGLQHRTINTARSAISMTHCEVDGLSMGKHPMVARVM